MGCTEEGIRKDVKVDLYTTTDAEEHWETDSVAPLMIRRQESQLPRFRIVLPWILLFVCFLLTCAATRWGWVEHTKLQHFLYQLEEEHSATDRLVMRGGQGPFDLDSPMNPIPYGNDAVFDDQPLEEAPGANENKVSSGKQDQGLDADNEDVVEELSSETHGDENPGLETPSQSRFFFFLPGPDRRPPNLFIGSVLSFKGPLTFPEGEPLTPTCAPNDVSKLPASENGPLDVTLFVDPIFSKIVPNEVGLDVEADNTYGDVVVEPKIDNVKSDVAIDPEIDIANDDVVLDSGNDIAIGNVVLDTELANVIGDVVVDTEIENADIDIVVDSEIDNVNGEVVLDSEIHDANGDVVVAPEVDNVHGAVDDADLAVDVVTDGANGKIRIDEIIINDDADSVIVSEKSIEASAKNAE